MFDQCQIQIRSQIKFPFVFIIQEILSPVSNNEVNEEADDQYENKRSLTVAETSENDEGESISLSFFVLPLST